MHGFNNKINKGKIALAKIYLKKNEERRLHAGHQWIFSNEIESVRDFKINGEVSELFSQTGKFLGKGFYNKNSLIAYRHLTDIDETIDRGYLFKKFNYANSLRRLNKHSGEVYRMVNSESDYLPGLIIDKFSDRYSLQIFSAGMNLMFDDVISVLTEQFKAKLIVEKNDNELRLMEGLQKSEGIVFDDTGKGKEPFMEIIDGIKYQIDLLKGQKTGFYLDQRKSRNLIRNYIHERQKVLDLFCNDGGFSLSCRIEGAVDVTGVDSSEVCINTAGKNAELNGVSEINFICSDVFDYLNNLFQTKDKYDLIILDPPSFTKSKKNLIPAIKGYIELNSKAMRLLKPNSMLFTFSCSHHISDKQFEEILINSSVNAKRKIQLIESVYSSFDHPVLMPMNETKYLKGHLLRVL